MTSWWKNGAHSVIIELQFDKATSHISIKGFKCAIINLN